MTGFRRVLFRSALLASPGGLHQRAVHSDDGLLEEAVGLLGPDLQARVIEDVEQREDVGLLEAAAEVAGGCGIGETAGAQSIEEDLIGAAEFEIL